MKNVVESPNVLSTMNVSGTSPPSFVEEKQLRCGWVPRGGLLGCRTLGILGVFPVAIVRFGGRFGGTYLSVATRESLA
ncbi:hypothetical protein [Halorarum halobium]|uniref:hypothetical protein n=1 Tax=Halorarum halobium TaxID=3075121 RepID=UPI0028AB532F|nr:hypothetical protein [Halobaculum sp. XH14]